MINSVAQALLYPFRLIAAVFGLLRGDAHMDEATVAQHFRNEP